MGGWGRGSDGGSGRSVGATLTQIPASLPLPLPLPSLHAAFKDSAICRTQENQRLPAAGWLPCQVLPSSVAGQISCRAFPSPSLRSSAGFFLLRFETLSELQ